MKALHLICRTDSETKRPLGVSKVENEQNIYMSCCWDFDLETAKSLVDGMIYFHDVKAENSYLGGRVLEAHSVRLDEDSEYHQTRPEHSGKRLDRVMFKFEITLEGRNREWRGKDHAMSWTSGIIEVND